MPNSPHDRSWALTCIPAAVLLATVSFDHTGWLNFSTVSVACVFALVIFSFYLPSRHLIGWTVVYVVCIVATLWVRRDRWSGGTGNPEALVATRALVAAAAGVLACLLARRREQVSLVAREFNRVLDQMAVPVILSDCDGWLIHINHSASDLLGGQVALGSPFFEHFSVLSKKGKSIRSYVDLATGATAGPVSTHLSVGPDKTRIHPAIMMRVDIGERPRVMTLVYPQDSDQPVPQLATNAR